MNQNPNESQNSSHESKIHDKFANNGEQIGNSFEEFPSLQDDSNEEKNEINEESFKNIMDDLDFNNVPSREEEPEKEDNKEINIILNNLDAILEDNVKLNEKISEITMIKGSSINLNESKELNETKKGLEPENNDKETTRKKNTSKSDKNKLKESSKIFLIYKDFDNKLLKKKRSTEHNKHDLDALNKDKFY